jgi:hypothetical protein
VYKCTVGKPIVTGGDNNPTIQEPSTPSPSIEEPTPTRTQLAPFPCLPIQEP